MTVRVDMDVYELMDDVYSIHFDKLKDVFGDTAYDCVESFCDDADRDCVDSIIEHKFDRMIKWCQERSDHGPLTAEDLYALDITEEQCEEWDIPVQILRDENGNMIRLVNEPSNQLKLFPEMEAGLPPMKLRIAVL